LLEQFPGALVESLRYLVGRFQLGENVELRSRLAVVSALHGEGVTTISRTLAAVIANDLDVRVCWVDLSWAVQRSQQAPELQGHDGIYEILTGRMELEEALQHTDDRRLVILRAGRIPDPQRPELARSPLLAVLLDDLEKQFDCVVFDMPPILAGSAGLNLVRHTDSYLLVVRHGVTTTQQVRAAADELRSVPSIGVVLNRYNSRVPNWLAHFFAP
jgi:Mrp family chromosome partitioning ATPase